MNAAACRVHKGTGRRFSYLAGILTLIAATGLCLGGQPEGRPAPARKRNSPVRLIQLPPPNTTGVVTLDQALLRQNTQSAMAAQPLGVVEIGQLLWAAATGNPLVSLGGLPDGEGMLVLYVVGTDGVYRYVPNGHYLEQVSQQGVLGAMQVSVMPQQAAAGCGIVMTLSNKTRFGRSDTPARRMMLLETGQRIQNLRLEASALDLAISIPQFDGVAMAKGMDLPRNTEILFALFAGYRPGPITGAPPSPLTGPGQARTFNKKAALIVAQARYMDGELSETNRVLNAAGIQTIIVSGTVGPITGVQGGLAQAGMALNQLRVDDVDAVVFIGGPGAAAYVGNPAAAAIARDANSKQKVLAAISTAPAILAGAGLVSGRRVTASETEREALVKAGAVFTGNAVERDQLMITASGPAASALFGQAIVSALQGG